MLAGLVVSVKSFVEQRYPKGDGFAQRKVSVFANGYPTGSRGRKAVSLGDRNCTRCEPRQLAAGFGTGRVPAGANVVGDPTEAHITLLDGRGEAS